MYIHYTILTFCTSCYFAIIDFKHFMKFPDDTHDQIVKVEKSLPELVQEMEEESDVYDRLRIFSNLTQFQVKIFKGEPKLVSAVHTYFDDEGHRQKI